MHHTQNYGLRTMTELTDKIQTNESLNPQKTWIKCLKFPEKWDTDFGKV